MKIISIIISLLGLGFPFFILAIRRGCLRESEVAQWRLQSLAPLTDSELSRLQQWQRLDVVLFTSFVLLGIVSAFLTWTGRIPRCHIPIFFGVFAVVGLTGLLYHFSQKCPRCRMNIGVQTSLLLPKACDRCGVAFFRRFTA